GNRFARAVRGETWPYGHLDALVTGAAGRELALVRALLGYGRRREAGAWLELGRGPTRPALARVLALSASVDHADPELVVTAGGPPLSPPSPTHFAEDGDRGAAVLAEAYPLIAGGRWDQAARLTADLPPRAATDAGRDVSLLVAYLAYKALDLGRARGL